MIPDPFESVEALSAVAHALVEARLECRPLARFPGQLPQNLDAAYKVQDIAMSLWPDDVAGWKVGATSSDQQRVYGEERIVGPIFRRGVQRAEPGQDLPFPVYAGGFAAVEAEFIFELQDDAPAHRIDWSPGEAADIVCRLYVGMEPASSPLASINQIGPAAVVSDFGNNAGLMLGPEVTGWRERISRGIGCATYIEDQLVGQGSSSRLPGGPLAALAFALNRCASRGRSLRAGDLITTGAASGIHDILPGQWARLTFEGVGEVRCRAVPATPKAPATQGVPTGC